LGYEFVVVRGWEWELISAGEDSVKNQEEYLRGCLGMKEQVLLIFTRALVGVFNASSCE